MPFFIASVHFSPYFVQRHGAFAKPHKIRGSLPGAMLRAESLLTVITEPGKKAESLFTAPGAGQALMRGVFLTKRNRFIKNEYYTSSMIAISAASPRRAPVLIMRV